MPLPSVEISREAATRDTGIGGSKKILKGVAIGFLNTALVVPEVYTGIKEGGVSGETKSVKAVIRGVVTTITGVMGAFVGSLAGPAGTFGGAVAGSVMGDELVDTMTLRNGLTDRSGRPVGGVDRHGVYHPPVKTAAPAEKQHNTPPLKSTEPLPAVIEPPKGPITPEYLRDMFKGTTSMTDVGTNSTPVSTPVNDVENSKGQGKRNN